MTRVDPPPNLSDRKVFTRDFRVGEFVKVDGRMIHRITDGVFDIAIDLDSILQTLAVKAMHNRSGRATECSGGVIVQYLKAERVTET